MNYLVHQTHNASVTGRKTMCQLIAKAVEDIEEGRFASPESTGSKTAYYEALYDQQAFVTAYLWVRSKRDDYPTAFQRICDTLNLPAERLRKKFNIEDSDSFFGSTDLLVLDADR